MAASFPSVAHFVLIPTIPPSPLPLDDEVRSDEKPSFCV